MKKHFLTPLIPVFLIFKSFAAAAPASPLELPAHGKHIPISEIIDENGRLCADGAPDGAVDFSGYRVTIDPAAGPVFTAGMAPCDWESLNTGLNGVVRAIAISGSLVYVGGDFLDAGGVAAADHIACWNGISMTWTALGAGLGDDVYAIKVGLNGLYVGGDFNNAGGINDADGIARWDGTGWQALGSGLLGNRRVRALAVDGANVYVGGEFNNAGGVNGAVNIARWDGAAWHALNIGGLNDVVQAIAISGGNVYAGGLFVNAGGNANADYIARWDGTAWHALGATPLTAEVRAVAVSGSDVYAGGNFTDAGGIAAADRIARWDGTAWHALSAGLNNFVDAIFVNGSDVYVGGNFTDAGGNVDADYIVRWDGSAWHAMGTPLNSAVYEITASGSDVYIGGVFNNNLSDPDLDYIAKWFEPLVFIFDNSAADENYLNAVNWLCNRIPPNPLPYDKAIVIAGDCNAGVNQVISAGASFTLEAGYTLNLLPLFTFTNNGSMVNNGGTFNIQGGLENFDLFQNDFFVVNSGDITNHTGAILLNSSGSFFSNEDGGQVDNFGTVENDGSFSLETEAEAVDNKGLFNNNYLLIVNGLFINNSGSSFTNVGIANVGYRFDNASAASNESGAVMNVNNGGVFSNDDEFDNFGTLDNKTGGRIDNRSIIYQNTGASLVNSGELHNESAGEVEFSLGSSGQNSGSFFNKSGALLAIRFGAIFANNTGAVLENEAAASAIQDGILTNAGSITNDGSWTNGGTTTTTSLFTNGGTANNSGTIINGGTLELETGSTLNNNALSTLTNTSVLNNNGSLNNNAALNNSGTFTNGNGGLVTLNSAGAFNNLVGGAFVGSAGSTLKGIGVFTNLGTFTNGAGTVIPGLSPGVLSLVGNFGLGTGELQIEVQSNAGPGPGHDLLQVTGTINLNNATLTVFQTGPVFNGSFTIVSATVAVTGTFSNVFLPADFSLIYTPTSVILVRLNLPVELIDFQAFEKNRTVQLDWRTATETNNRGFQIERSADGSRWTTLGFVAGKGTTRVEQRYTFTDLQPLPGINYYRLRQEDLDGRFEYSNIQSVKINTGSGKLQFAPNPVAAGADLNITFENAPFNGEVLLFDLAGRQLSSLNTNKGTLTLPAGLEPGVYLIKALTEQGEWPLKLIVK